METALTRLIAVWLTLLALVGAIAALEYAAGGAGPGEGADGGLLVPVPAHRIGALELGHEGRLHRFERDGEGAWFYHQAHAGANSAHAHRADPARAQRIADALAAFGRTRVERRLPFDARSKQYGVGEPKTLVLVYGIDDPLPLAQYAIGDLAPDTFSRYVLRAGAAEVVTIPDYQVRNLLTLIEASPRKTP